MTQLPLPAVPVQLLPARAQVRSPLRWAGAKRWLAPILADGIWHRLAATGGIYIEPFLGGASVALDLGLRRMLLADVCAPLISMFMEVVASPVAVIDHMEWLHGQVAPLGLNAETYYRLREFKPVTTLDGAAKFLMLNSTCFNGVYRVNRSGKFNVPYGDRTEKHYPDLQQLHDVHRAFLNADFAVSDFRKIIAKAKKGDVIMADPPYFETFTGYDKGKFTLDDQKDLALWLKHAADKGATVVATNSDFPEVRELYKDFEIIASLEPRKVNRDGKGRQPAACLIITNDLGILHNVQ